MYVCTYAFMYVKLSTLCYILLYVLCYIVYRLRMRGSIALPRRAPWIRYYYSRQTAPCTSARRRPCAAARRFRGLGAGWPKPAWWLQRCSPTQHSTRLIITSGGTGTSGLGARKRVASPQQPRGGASCDSPPGHSSVTRPLNKSKLLFQMAKVIDPLSLRFPASGQPSQSVHASARL